MLNPDQIQTRLEYILPTVEKPGRYVGGEFNQVVKDWARNIRIALVFPDIYDIGMSNLGLAILYDLINQRSDALAERAYAPWVDMEAALRSSKTPLYSLETKHALGAFDIIGISLPYETLYTNTLNILDLAEIPVISSERSESHPLIIAGGHATFNPEPMHAFVDAFVVGEGEEVLGEIIDVYKDWKIKGENRKTLLGRLSQIWGVYIPSLYRSHYFDDGTFSHMEKLEADTPLPIMKRIVAKLPPPTTRFIVPYIDTVHNRIPIEIMRGCTRGCRFCQAGMITRPVRERTVDEIIQAIEEGIRNTGYEDVGLLSLSSSDYTHILELVNAVGDRFLSQHLSMSLPSLRIESFSVDLMNALKGTRRSGFTLAPEAATERMRDIINKPVSTAQLLDTAHAIYSRGWTTIKLYYMIGHPSETMEDVQAIANLCKAVLTEGRKVIGMRAQVNAGVSTFVPKPHTPFQWVPSESIEMILNKQALLKRELRGAGLKLNWNSPKETMLEAWLSRGDRRLAEVIFHAWQNGAKFDAWNERFSYDTWLEAFQVTGLDPNFYTLRERPIDENFPWDHISTSVLKKFLTEDYLWSLQGRTRIDCRQRCFACGVLPTFADLRRMNPGEVWQCPEVKSKRIAVKDFSVNMDVLSPGD
ncbi:MAG: B12-binding domain-containing radical SAM protein [Chloroflexi bacterium RBG_16_52_11]|nr:MAG: B12-binding domain-containing radical SAM protein [Chloroflexi bacterium RBG_16_52_11]